MSSFSLNKILLISITLSTMLLIITALSAPIIDESSDIFQYSKSLPITYWIGLSFSLLVLLWKGKLSKVATICLVMLIGCYVFALPSVVYVNDPGSRDAYGHMSYAFYTMENGNTTGSGADRFPGAYVSMAELLTVTGMDSGQVMKAFHPFFVLFMALTAYLIALRMSDRKYAYFAPLAILGLSWFGNSFGKHTYGYMLYAILLLTIIIYLKSSNSKFAFLSFIIYGALVITHPLSSLLVSVILSAFFFGLYLKKRSTLLGSLVLLFFVIWCSWYIVTSFFTKDLVASLRMTYELLLQEFNEPMNSTVNYIINYSTEYMTVIYLRIFSSLFIIISGVALSVIALFKKVGRTGLLLVVGILICAGIFIGPWSRTSLANLDRGIEHSLIYLSALISLVIGFKIVSPRKAFRIGKKGFATLLLALFSIMILLMPVASFTSSMSFMNISTPSHNEADFISAYYTPVSGENVSYPDIAMRYHSILKGNLQLFFKSGESLDTLYNICKDNVSAINESLVKYNLVVLTHEYYNLDQFYQYTPTFGSFLMAFNQTIDTNSYFNKVYSDAQDSSIYVQANA